MTYRHVFLRYVYYLRVELREQGGSGVVKKIFEVAIYVEKIISIIRLIYYWITLRKEALQPSQKYSNYESILKAVRVLLQMERVEYT